MIDGIEILHQTNEVGQGVPILRDRELVFWILMICNLLFIAIARTVRPHYLSALFFTAIINRQLIQKSQEELKLLSFSSAILSCTYFINLGVLISYGINGDYGFFTLKIIGLIAAIVCAKWMMMWFLSFVTENKAGILQHGLNHLVFFQVGGIILTPIIILSHFLSYQWQSPILLATLIFVGFLIVLREFQSIARAIKARISLLYIILYLCTLELLPLVLVFYAFVNNMIGLN
ncbi:MAG: DUF4271 domain-containing protein [Crocinitomicaceae bacterium]